MAQINLGSVIGPAGADAPQIDDEHALTTNPWSGQKTRTEIDSILVTPERTTFFDIHAGTNKFNNAEVGAFTGRIDESGNIIDSTDVENFGYCRTGYIPIKPNTVYSALLFFSGDYSAAPHPEMILNYIWFDATKTKISHGTGQPVNVTSPANAAYLMYGSSYGAYFKQDPTATFFYLYGMLVEGGTIPQHFEAYTTIRKIPSTYIDIDDVSDQVEPRIAVTMKDYGVIPDVERAIPDYVKTAAAAVSVKVAALQATKTFSMAWITDMHLYQFSEATANVFPALDIVGRAGYVRVCGIGGDNTTDRATKDGKLSSMRDVQKAMLLNKTVPMWVLKGNHDDGSAQSYPEGKVTDDEMFTVYDKRQANGFVINPEQPDGMYCYKDFEGDCVRVFFLNCVDVIASHGGQWEYAFGNTQLNWFAEKLMDTPAGYGVVVATHITPLNLPAFGPDYVGHNGQVMFDILSAAKTGTSYSYTHMTGDYPCSVSVDFTGKDIDVMGIIVGHNHTDVDETVDDILIVSTIDASADNALTPQGGTPKVDNSAAETGYDIFTFNRQTRVLNITRYGAGEDRELEF